MVIMIRWIKDWLYHRRIIAVAAKLTPWLLFYGEKQTYSQDEVDYAIERSQLPAADKSLAYAIFCDQLSSSAFYRQEGYAEYLNNSRNFHRAAQKYGTGTFHSKTSVLDDIDKG